VLFANNVPDAQSVVRVLSYKIDPPQAYSRVCEYRKRGSNGK